jgi:hypothetical protein
MSHLRVVVSDEKRSRLQKIMAHYGLESLTAAIWFAVADLYRRAVTARKERD